MQVVATPGKRKLERQVPQLGSPTTFVFPYPPLLLEGVSPCEKLITAVPRSSNVHKRRRFSSFHYNPHSRGSMKRKREEDDSVNHGSSGSPVASMRRRGVLWKIPAESKKELAEIAKQLNEPKLDLLLRVYICLGRERFLMLLQKAREIEENGGLYFQEEEEEGRIVNKKRTPGGVFLHLVRSNCVNDEERKRIFALRERTRGKKTDKDEGVYLYKKKAKGHCEELSLRG